MDLLGFGMIIPILPFYAQKYGANAFEIGVLMGCFSFFQFALAPVWGRASDFFGRRPILLICIFGSSIAYVLLGLADSYLQLLITRSLAGAFAANIATGYAYVSDTISPSHRTKAMGLLGAAMGVGFTIGPAIGALLSKDGFALPNYVAASISLVNFTFGWIWLKEPAGLKEKRQKLRNEKKFRFETFFKVMNHLPSQVGIVVFFLYTLALTQMEVMFAVYMGDFFGFNAESTGYLMFAMGMIMILIQGGLIGRLVAKFGERSLLQTGLVISIVALVLYAFSSQFLWLSVTSLCALAAGRGVLQPNMTTLATYQVDPTLRGVTMGFYQAGSSLARVLGPITAGWLYYEFTPATPFLVGAGYVVCALVYFLALSSRLPAFLKDPAERQS